MPPPDLELAGYEHRSLLEADYSHLWAQADFLAERLQQRPVAVTKADLGRSLFVLAELFVGFDDYHFNHGEHWQAGDTARTYRCLAAETVIRRLNPVAREELTQVDTLSDRISRGPAWAERLIDAVEDRAEGPRVIAAWKALLTHSGPPETAQTLELFTTAARELADVLAVELTERFGPDRI